MSVLREYRETQPEAQASHAIDETPGRMSEGRGMHDVVMELTQRARILDVVTQLFVRTDQRDWQAVRQCFADRVLFDMSSLTGGEAAMQSADEIVAGWKSGLEPLHAIHHQVGNFLIEIDGQAADVFCYGIASHYLENPTPANTRVFVGSYDLHLVQADDRWHIDRFRFNLKYIEGNRDLEASAPR